MDEPTNPAVTEADKPVVILDGYPLECNFSYHAPTPDQIERMQHLRTVAKSLAASLLHSVPSCRERSVALTNIEQSVMWANAGIVRSSARRPDPFDNTVATK